MWATWVVYIILAIALFLADHYQLGGWIHEQKWIILSFFAALSYMSHLLHTYGMQNNREKFIEFSLSFTIIRLVASIVFIALFVYFKVSKPFLFVANFFALYLFFTFFEIINILRKLRRF